MKSTKQTKVSSGASKGPRIKSEISAEQKTSKVSTKVSNNPGKIENSVNKSELNLGASKGPDPLMGSNNFDQDISPSPAELLEEITQLLKSPLVKGQFWYLIGIDWFRRWKRFTDFKEDESTTAITQIGQQQSTRTELGPIDNSRIINEDGELLQNLSENLDYKIIPEEAWMKLVDRYGLKDGKHAIKREVILIRGQENGLKVEIYEMDLYVFIRSNRDEVKKVSISQSQKIDDLKIKIKTAFGIPQHLEIRLYVKREIFELVKDYKHHLADAGIEDGQQIMIESQNENKKWPKTVLARSTIAS